MTNFPPAAPSGGANFPSAFGEAAPGGPVDPPPPGPTFNILYALLDAGVDPITADLNAFTVRAVEDNLNQFTVTVTPTLNQELVVFIPGDKTITRIEETLFVPSGTDVTTSFDIDTDQRVISGEQHTKAQLGPLTASTQRYRFTLS